MQIKELKGNPKNPRLATDEKLTLLKKSLAEFGDLSGIVFNRKTKQLVGGHQRKDVLPQSSEITLTKKHAKPTKVGTVAEGFVTVNGERFSYREVYWSDAKEKAANIASNKGAGEWNLAQLSNWMKELEGFGFDLDLTMFNEDERFQFLMDVNKINSGDENDEWAKMGEEHEFNPGKDYVTLAIHFKTEKARLKYIEDKKIEIKRKLKTVWISYA